jgi:hypothetical protein
VLILSTQNFKGIFPATSHERTEEIPESETRAAPDSVITTAERLTSHPKRRNDMAMKDHTTKARPGRNPAAAQAQSASSPPMLARLSTSIPNLEVLENAIEDERARLMTVHTLLSCIGLAMEAGQGDPDAPHYLTIIEMARDLVDESIRRLDSVPLRRVGAADIRGVDDKQDETSEGSFGGNYEVREPAMEYGLH